MSIGFLHTSPVHVPTFDALVAQRLPRARVVHTVDESLLADARADGPASVASRVRGHVRRLQAHGTSVVCCTCSTLGGVAEQLATPQLPVIRVDRPMAAHAVRAGQRVAVVAALESTLAPTRALLLAEAHRSGREIKVTTATASEAWARFEAGDAGGYLHSIAETARRAAAAADVVVLAQASMAGAEALLDDVDVPMLSSPRLAVEHLATSLWGGASPGTGHEKGPRSRCSETLRRRADRI